MNIMIASSIVMQTCILYLQSLSPLEFHLGYFIFHPFWNVRNGVSNRKLDPKNKMLQ